MAPEGGLGELIVFDFSPPPRLGYRAYRVIKNVHDEPLYVLWQASRASEGLYQPIGGGVVYLDKRTRFTEEVLEGFPTDLGEGNFEIADYPDASGSMMVFVLPPGYTLEPQGRQPKAAKDFGGRLAVFWRLEGGKQVSVRWAIRPGSGNVHSEAVRLNRAALEARDQPRETPGAGPLVQGYAPRVFISYSGEVDPEADRAHKTRVRAFSKRLRSNGIDARIYDYAPAPPEGLSTWMRNEIQNADFVLLACTPEYQRRYEKRAAPGIGAGVTWEGAIIQTLLREQSTRNRKFIPVLFDAAARPDECVPLELRDYARYDVSNARDYEQLLRVLTGQPGVIVPPLGPRPDLPPEDGS